jgi:hypothetical protein
MFLRNGLASKHVRACQGVSGAPKKKSTARPPAQPPVDAGPRLTSSHASAADVSPMSDVHVGVGQLNPGIDCEGCRKCGTHHIGTSMLGVRLATRRLRLASVTDIYGIKSGPVFSRNKRCDFCRHLFEQKRASSRFPIKASPQLAHDVGLTRLAALRSA